MTTSRTLAFLHVAAIICSITSQTKSFAPVSTGPRRKVAFNAAPVEEPSLTVEEDAKKTLLPEKQRAEAQARARHDNFAMNALFVNVPEHPEPKDCVIERGKIPADLPPGCLLRIGPNGAGPNDGWLDGDGLIQCIVLPPSDGKTSKPLYSSKYVETQGRTLEQAEPPKKFRGTLGSAPEGWPMLWNLVQNGIDFSTMTVQKDTCNTALACMGNRVLALMEQSPPSEISVSKQGHISTLASMCRLDGAIPSSPITGGSLSAHGRTDSQTGERIHVSYSSSTKPFVRIDTFGKDGWKLVSTVGVDVPAPVMIHDSAITEKYVVILDFPLTVRPKRFLLNTFPVEYEPTNGARIGLCPRQNSENKEGDSSKQTIWFDVNLGVTLHLANAFERSDGSVVIHGFNSIPKGESSYILDYTPAFLHEWILDPVSKTVLSDKCLNPTELVEFPTVEERFVGSRDIDYIYGLQATSIGGPLHECKTPQAGVLLDEVVKFAATPQQGDPGQVVDRYTLEPGWHFVSEPTPVTKSTGEACYLLLIATYVPRKKERSNFWTYTDLAQDGVSMKSRLLILDGSDMASGPVAILALPKHINYGLHSLYLPWEKMV